MLKLFSTIIIVLLSLYKLSAQNCDSAIKMEEEGKYLDAIKSFDLCIKEDPSNVTAWYNRGITKNKIGDYDNALLDFEQTIKLSPGNKKAYLNRGTSKKHLTDYSGAIADYSIAIKLDSNYADAYYNRGIVFTMLGNRDDACSDYKKALAMGISLAERKVSRCNDTSNKTSTIHPILRLTKISSVKHYGFSSSKPIKVGIGPEGGPANQRSYLELLRDEQGKPIQFQRVGSCCEYPSENGFLGTAMLDMYEITYRNRKGKSKHTILYISFYDYEELLIPYGFKTIGMK